jgi:hypothetical protein
MVAEGRAITIATAITKQRRQKRDAICTYFRHLEYQKKAFVNPIFRFRQPHFLAGAPGPPPRSAQGLRLCAIKSRRKMAHHPIGPRGEAINSHGSFLENGGSTLIETMALEECRVQKYRENPQRHPAGRCD